MLLSPVDDREKKIRSITLWGAVLNIFLVIFKIITGVMVKSSALIADGAHSLSDLFTDIVVLIGTRISSRPADENHPYGHKRFDIVASQLVALVLFIISIGFIWSAGVSIYHHEHNYPGFLVLIVAGISVITKEIAFLKTRKVSLETESPALYANAWHHRSDSFSSVAVLLGGIVSLFGWGHADQMATIIVGFMIMGVAAKLFYEGLIELTEHSADKKSIQAIENVLFKEAHISRWHALRTRKIGGELFVDVHILVDPDLSVRESHEVSEKVEEKIKQEISRPVNILVHIEPEIPASQKK